MTDDTSAQGGAAAGAEGQAGDGQQAAAAAEPQWYQKIWDPERPGSFVKKWQEMLPDDFEDTKAMLANYDGLPGMAKSVKDLTTQVRNGKGLKPLTPESTPEEVTAYRKALGIPDEPYSFEKPKELPEGIEWQEDRAKVFGKWAQEQNLTPAQAKGVHEYYTKMVAEDFGKQTAAQKQAYDENLAAEKEAIRTQFGGKLDGVVTEAKRVALKYNLPPDVMEPNSKIFAGVTMLKVFSDMAKALGESVLPTAAAVVNTDPLRQAKAMREKGHVDYDALKRGDKTAMDKYYGLLRMAKEQGLIDAA